MKKTSIIVITFLLVASLSCLLQGAEPGAPLIRNQGQSTSAILPDGSITFSAQGKDDTALQWAWLSTDETGEWRNLRGWWDFSWAYGRVLRIDHTKVAGDLTNFPVLISLASSAFITHAQADGDDFVFTDSTNTTQLNHEIEYYNGATGEIIAWVNVPFISSTQDTIIYLYYGNPSCSSQQHMEGTWNAGYKMVHHMDGATYSQITDSTASHWNVTSAGGSPIYNQNGKIGKAVDFHSYSYLKTGNFRLPYDQTYTASAWVYVDGGLSTQRYLFEGDSTNYAISLSVDTDGRFWTFINTTGGMIDLHSTTYTSVTYPEWYYVCTRVDTNTNQMTLFVNGVPEGTKAIPGAVYAEQEGLNIATNCNNNGNYMYGTIDELRIASVPWSDAWIATEYAMMSSPSTFLSTSQESTPRGVQQYGSPKKLQETSDWQWSNFTWHNPTVAQGSVIHWRITFQDTSGITNQSVSMSFTILGSAPDTPHAPEGPTTGTVTVPVSFITHTTDPDLDTVAFMFDWGDGNHSDWTSFVSSGSPVTESYTWYQPGTYQVKVKAQDTSGAETAWSPTTTIAISAPLLPPLFITAPTSVMEGTSFIVTVTSNNTPVNHALVTFHSTSYYTNQSGTVRIIASQVTMTTQYQLTAQHESYQSAVVTITVVDSEQPGEAKGWLYGWVSNTSGAPLQNAELCIFVPGKNTTALCAFTDEQGRYNVRIPAGTYTVEARKRGYTTKSQPSTLIEENHALELNFILAQVPSGTPQPPGNQNRDIIEAMIEEGIATQKILGKLQVHPTYQNYTLTVYHENLSAEVLFINLSQVLFTVRATDIPGTIFAIKLVGQTNVEDIQVMVDNQVLPQVGFSEILSHTTHETVYARMLDTTNEGTTTYCLVSLPHFSDHEVQITTLLAPVPWFSGTLVIITYIAVALLGFIFLLLPILRIERKRP